MANKKFSDFTSKTSPSDVSFVVGYDGSDNVRISPGNLLGAYLPLAGGTMTGNIVLNDNVKSIYGTASDGLEIYHDGSNSYVSNTGTGSLIIQDTNGTGDILIRPESGQTAIGIYNDNAVELSFAGVTKFSTLSTGVSVTGAATLSGGALIMDSDWAIQLGSTNATIEGNSSGTVLRFNASDYFKWTDGGTTRMVLDASGNLGIGLTAPTEKLSVTGGNIAIDNGSNYILGGATSGNAIIGRIKSTAGVYTVDGEGTRSIRLGSATNGEVARIDNTNGRVGIGTDAPTAKLQVVGLAEHADNSAATTAGLTAGAFYRTGDLLKVVH